MDDVVLSKAGIIERCLKRVREEHAGDDGNLTDNITRQDSIVLNLQRACEAAIDLAMHRVRRHRLGVPQDSREAFDLLARAGELDEDLAEALRRMVGFRNVAIHDYVRLDPEGLRAILHTRLDDLQRSAMDSIRRLEG